MLFLIVVMMIVSGHGLTTFYAQHYLMPIFYLYHTLSYILCSDHYPLSSALNFCPESVIFNPQSKCNVFTKIYSNKVSENDKQIIDAELSALDTSSHT